jgi:hypothetical protein
MDGGRCSGLEEPCQEENARWKNCKVSQENGRCYKTKGVFTRCILGFSRIIWEDQRLRGEASAPCRAKRPQSSSASRLTGGAFAPVHLPAAITRRPGKPRPQRRSGRRSTCLKRGRNSSAPNGQSTSAPPSIRCRSPNHAAGVREFCPAPPGHG